MKQQIDDIKRQEDIRKAEHNRHLAETTFIQEQREDLEMKNALLEQEMQAMQDEARRRQQQEHEHEEQRRLERAAPLTASPPPAPLHAHDPPQEVFLSNEKLLAELTTLKKAISASSHSPSSDDELLAMFSRLQFLQDVLEKRDVEIDAAQLLARSFRRQSGLDVGPQHTLQRRRSSMGEATLRKSFSRGSSLDERQSLSRQDSDDRKSFSRRSSLDERQSLSRQDSDDRKSFSRRSSLDERQSLSRQDGDDRKSFSRRSSLDERKSLSRQDSDDRQSFSRLSGLGVNSDSKNQRLDRLGSSGSIRSNSFNRQGSVEDTFNDEDLDMDDVYGQQSDVQDMQQVEEDPRIIKLQEQISLLSNNILSKSFSDNTLLVMFDELDDLKQELAMLKGANYQPEVIRTIFKEEDSFVDH